MKRCRVGIIVPWMNRAVEDELPSLVADADVGIHWARILPNPPPSGPRDETYLPRLLAQVPMAIEQLAPSDLEAIVLACTSAAIGHVTGPHSIRVVTAYECLSSSLLRVPLLLCDPYSEDLSASIVGRLESDGHRVVSSARIPTYGEFRDVSAEAIAAIVARAIGPEAEQVAISCTALYTADVPRILREKHSLGVPVTTSISAIATFIRGLCKDSYL